MTIFALMMMLAGPIRPDSRRSIIEETRLQCEKEGFVDVRDFGACGTAPSPFTPEEEEQAVRNAEDLARTCIPGRVLPVRYCPAKPTS